MKGNKKNLSTSKLSTSKKREKKNNNKNIQVTHCHVNVYSNQDKGKSHAAVLQKKKNDRFVKAGDELIDYAVLARTLNKTTANKIYVEKMDTRMIPYEIPEAYSLEIEIENLAMRKTRMDVLGRKICISVKKAMTNDFWKAGRDINEAICRARDRYVGRV